MGYILLNFYPKNTQNLDQQVNQQQNTVCLKQQIYASPENFTPTLLVSLETFRRSGPSMDKLNHFVKKKNGNTEKKY